MVDKNQIRQTFNHYFSHWGDLDIDHQGVVNVSGSVTLNSNNITKLPVKFGTVTRFFNVSGSSLQSLEGCPHTVRNFSCARNNLTSLEHGPIKVGGMYLCDNNRLTNLMGAPTHGGVAFSCEANPLTSLEGIPEHDNDLPVLTLTLPYSPTLPLLRICLVNNKKVVFSEKSGLTYARKMKLEKVFNSPDAQGPGGVLQVASLLYELSQEPHNVYDFEGNAEF